MTLTLEDLQSNLRKMERRNSVIKQIQTYLRENKIALKSVSGRDAWIMLNYMIVKDSNSHGSQYFRSADDGEYKSFLSAWEISNSSPHSKATKRGVFSGKEYVLRPQFYSRKEFVKLVIKIIIQNILSSLFAGTLAVFFYITAKSIIETSNKLSGTLIVGGAPIGLIFFLSALGAALSSLSFMFSGIKQVFNALQIHRLATPSHPEIQKLIKQKS